MYKDKKIFFISKICFSILLAVIFFSILNVRTNIHAVESFTVNGATYVITSDSDDKREVALVKYNGNAEDFSYMGSSPTNPNNNKTYTLTAIQNSAFNNNNKIKAIRIPSTVTSIGDYAFYNCTNLQSVIIPGNVETIGEYAFANCRLLSDLSFEKPKKSKLEIIPKGFLSRSGTETSNFVFSIPDSVTTIRGGAFYDSGITQLKIGKNLSKLENIMDNSNGNGGLSAPFSGMARLDRITVDDNNTSFKTDSEGRFLYNYYAQNQKPTTVYLHAAKDPASDIKLENSIRVIYVGAFQYNQYLDKVHIPFSQTLKIQQSAFGTYFYYDWTQEHHTKIVFYDIKTGKDLDENQALIKSIYKALKNKTFMLSGSNVYHDGEYFAFFDKVVYPVVCKYYHSLLSDFSFKVNTSPTYNPFSDLLANTDYNNISSYLSAWANKYDYGADTQVGNNNSNKESSITKSSRWTNAEKTQAETEINLSYNLPTENKYDILFVIDMSGSMYGISDPEDILTRDLAVTGLVSNLSKKILEAGDNRIGIVFFHDKNQTRETFIPNSLDLAQSYGGDSGFISNKVSSYVDGYLEETFGNQPFDGTDTDFLGPLGKGGVVEKMIQQRKDKSRQPVVVLVSDGGDIKNTPEALEDNYNKYFAPGNKMGGGNKDILIRGILMAASDSKKTSIRESIDNACGDPANVAYGSNLAEIQESFLNILKSIHGIATLKDYVNTDLFNVASIKYKIGNSGDWREDATVSHDGKISLPLNMGTSIKQTVTMNIGLTLKTQYWDFSGSIPTNKGSAELSFAGCNNSKNSVKSPVLYRYGINIHKTDDDAQSLAGASFRISCNGETLKFKKETGNDGYYYYLYTTKQEGSETVTSNSDGQILLRALPKKYDENKTFTITETSAPTGYSKSASKQINIPSATPTYTSDISITDKILSRQLVLEKCFEVGDLTDAEVLEKASAIKFIVSGTKVNGEPYNTSTYTITNSSFSHRYSYIDNKRYVCFYRITYVPAGQYTVTEDISNENFFSNNGTYVSSDTAKSSSNNLYYAPSSIIAELLKGKPTKSIQVDLRGNSNQYVFFLNTIKTTNLDINKVISSNNKEDHQNNDYTFEIQGTDLLNQTFVWRFSSAGVFHGHIKLVSKYKLDSMGNKVDTKESNDITSQWVEWSSNTKGYKYSLYNLPYSPTGYTIRESSSSANFDMAQTKVYNNEDDFKNNKNGTNTYTANASLDNNFTTYFRNTVVGKIVVNKTSEDNIVSGLKFMLKGNGKSLTVATDSKGQAVFNNIPIYNDTGSAITYEIVETEIPRRYDTPSYKINGTTLTKNKTSGMYPIGSLNTNKLITVDVSNTLKKATLNIKKTFNGKNIASESENFAGIIFSIYQYSSSGKLISTKVGTTDNNGEILLNNLPIYDTNNKTYKYVIEENPETAKKFSSVSYSTDPSSVNNVSYFRFSSLRSTVTFYVNNETTSNLIIEKKDADTQEPLSQAEFCLYSKENPNTPLNFEKTKESNYTYVSKQTNSSVNKLVCVNGVLTIINLPNGSYLVKEIKAPANYEISETQPKEVTLKNSSGQTVVFYDKLLGQKVKIFKFAEGSEGLSYSKKQLTDEQKEILEEKLFNTKFKISGTTQNNLSYEKELTVDSSWKLTNIVITKNYSRRAWGYYTEIEVPYGKYSISEIASSDMFDLSKTNIRKTNEIIASSNSNEDWNSWTKDYLFQNTSEVINNKNASVDFPVDTSTTNESIIFYNKFKTYPVNIYKVIDASSIEEALMVAKDTSFKLTGGVSETVPSITKTNNGKIELNTDGGWTISNKVINNFGSSPYYCFKYTVDNVNASKQLSIQEYAGENCDKKLSFASMKNSRFVVYGSSLYNKKTGDLDPFIVNNDAFDKDSKDVYFFNSPKRNVLNIVKSANMFTAPNDSSEISKETVLNSLRGTEFYISGKDYLGQEVNKVVTINNSWKINQNSKGQYYAFYQVKGNDGGYPLKGNYKITEVLPGDTDFVAEKTKVYNYTAPSGESIESLTSYYEDMRDFTVSQSTNCNTLEGPICAAFYNVKDYVSLTINKYTDVSTGDKVLTKAELIKLLDGTKFRISGITASGQEYSKTIVINEENQALFTSSFDNSSGSTHGSYLECVLKVPRSKDSYTIEEIESPNYDLSKTVSWFGSYNNKKTSTVIELPLGSKENENKTEFFCGFYNKQKTTNLTIYKILDYDGIVLNNETDLTKTEEKTIMNYFKDLKFDISCDAFYGTYKTSLSTNSTSLWSVGCANNRVYIYTNIAIPLGKCTITETAANGSMEHKYFDLSQTSVSKFFTDALYPKKYSNSIVETYTGDISSSRVFFANRLKTKKIKVALFGDGANKAEDAKELLNESRFKIVANSTVSGVPYQTREIVLYKDKITSSPATDSNQLKLEYYTSSDGTVYSGLSYAEITVPEGNYSVTETSSNDFYDLSKTTYAWDAKNAILGQKVGTTYTRDVTSTANATAKTFSFYFYNRYSLGDIVVKKIDSETKTPIAGVEFSLLDKNAQTLKFKQDTTYTDKNPVYILDETNGSEVLKTGVNGTFTIKDMAYGIYYLSETSTNVDYASIEDEILLELTSPTITREVPNSLKQETLRIVKAAEDISADTTDGNTILKGLAFNIEGTQKNGQSYKNSIVIDKNTAINHGLINNSAYFYFDVKVPLGSYTVTEDTSNAPKYAADKIYTADSIEKIFDENNRVLGNSVNVVVDSVNTTTEDDNIADTACFYNTLNYAKLQLYKFVPNVKNTSYLKQLLSGTKFIVEGVNGSSYYQEFVIDPQNLTWTPTSSSVNGEVYRGYKLASYITLPVGKYNVKEIVNDNFDESKTLAGWSIASALSSTPRTSYEITMTSTTVTYNRTFINYPKTTTVRIGKTADNAYDNVSSDLILKYFEGLEFKFKDMIFGDTGYNETIKISSDWQVATVNNHKYVYKDIEIPNSVYSITESSGSNTYYNVSSDNTYCAYNIEDVLNSNRINSNSISLTTNVNPNEVYFFNTANAPSYTIVKAVKGNIDKEKLLELVKGTTFRVESKDNSDPNFESFDVEVGDNAFVTPDEYGRFWNYAQKTSTVDNSLYSYISYTFPASFGNYTVTETPNKNFDNSKVYVGTNLDDAVKNSENNVSATSHNQFVSIPSSSDKTSVYESLFINTLGTRTLRISKFADNIKTSLTDKQVHTYLNGLQFNVKDISSENSTYNETVSIDNTWTVGSNGDYKYLYKDFELPIGQYSVTENIASSKNIYYNAEEIYVASSQKDILDASKRTKSASTSFSLLTSSDTEVCFFNTQKLEKFNIYKYVPNLSTSNDLFTFVNGTKFVITGITDPTFKKELVVNNETKGDWTYGRKALNGTMYQYMRIATPLQLPTGKYSIAEIPNSNTNKTKVGWSLENALSQSDGTSFDITISSSNKSVIYSRTFVNYPGNKTIRLIKVADNTFDSVSDANVRKYLEGLQFTFKDNMFGNNGYNKTITIDSSWKLGKSNGYKYLYKDIDVLASNYTVTEGIGNNVYYDAKLTKTYTAKTIQDVLDSSKRTQSNSASLNVASNESELYFFNTANPTKLTLYKAIEGDITNAIKLVAGTKFVLTNETDGSVTTIVVPEEYNVADSLGGKWSASKRTLETGETYTVLSYAVMGLTPGNYTITEIPNSNFSSSKIYAANTLKNANQNRIDETSSNSYSFIHSRPFIQNTDVTPVVFINTIATKTIRISKVANNTFSNLSNSTVLNYLNGLQFNIKNTTISSGEFDKTVTIDNTWSVATNGQYKYVYKDIEVPAGIYTVEEAIGSNTTFDAKLNETYYQSSIKNVLNKDLRQKGTKGAVTTSENANEICFFNTAGPTNYMMIYKAIKGYTNKAAMLDLVKGTKFKVTNIIDNSSFVVTVGENAYTVNDEYGRKWGYFSKVVEGDTYTVMSYKIEGLPLGRYIVKEVPNNNFNASQIRVSSNLTNATKADFKDNITLTAHKPNSVLTSAFINPLTTKTIRIAKLADNVYNSTSDKDVRAYLNGLQFKISDNYFKDGYSETLTIDDSWTIVKDDSKKLKYVYKDIEVPVSSYSIEETVGTNTIYDLDKTYNQKTLNDVTNNANRVLGTKATVNVANNETEAYFYNTTKPTRFIIDKSVEGVNNEAELHRLIDGTKFVITNKKTSENATYTVDSTWKYKVNTSSTTGKKYGTLYKELKLNASVYSIEEIVNDNFEQNKVKVGWSIEKAEEELYSNPTTFTIANPKSSIARYFINTLKTSTIKLVKVADITTNNVKDSVVYDVLKGLNINVKSNNYNKTYTIDNNWTIASGNGYKYLYKEITVPYGKYTITETAGSNTLFDMSNVFNSEDLSKVTNSKQRSKGSSFQLVVNSSSESAYIYNVAKLSNVRLVKETDYAPEAYMRQVVNGTIFTVTGTDFVGRSVKETFTINNSWKYSTTTINSKEYSYLYYDIKLLPGSYTIKETPSSSCDASKITAGAGLSKAINSTTHTNTMTLKINAASESYWRVFYNHLKESILYLSKIGSNISSTASAANTHKYLDGLQFKIEGKTALGQTYSQTFKIDSSWYLGTAGNYRKLTRNVSLPYGTYTITETSGNNTNYDLDKTQFAFNSKDILDPNKRQLGTSTSITVSSTNSYGAVFFNVVKEKPEYSVSNTTASTPGSSHVGIINTHVKNGATESYNEGKNIPVVVLLRDKDGNVVTIAQQKVNLKPQEEKDLTFSITYPSNISPEEYEIEVRINWDNRNSEQNSNNNKDITTINPYDFSMDDVGLKSNKASVGGKISLVPKISYNGAKAFTDNSATLQFYILDGAGNQIGDMLSEIPLSSIGSLLDSNGKLNIEPGSSWTIGSDSSPLVLTLPGELSSNTEYNILARVNWVNRTKELNANNNEKISSFKSVNNIDIKIEPVYPNSSYYVGTEVISTYIVDNQSNSFDVYPGYLKAKFSVTALFPDGSTKVVPLDASNSTKNVVVPQKSTGIVYFKWTIPEKVDGVSLVGASLTCNATLLPQTFEDSDPSNDTANIVKKVYEFDVSHANDTNYEKDSNAAMDALKADHSAEGIKISNFVEKAIDAMNSFDKKTTRQGDDDLSVFQYKNQASWDEWSYDRSNGFRLTTYRANLKNSVFLGADTAHMAKASSSASSNIKEFKSGYGFGVETNASINKIGLSLPTGSYTNAQYSACFFPEYLFSDKKGEYETLVYNTTKKAFEIANNKYGNNLHYTPIWYPDIVSDRGNYPVAVEFTQCWTPAGVISSKHTDNSIKINGNIYDDWYQQQH